MLGNRGLLGQLNKNNFKYSSNRKVKEIILRLQKFKLKFGVNRERLYIMLSCSFVLGGIVKDICGCCDVCAKVLGERCGGPFYRGRTCDEGLKCVKKELPDLDNRFAYGTCGKTARRGIV